MGDHKIISADEQKDRVRFIRHLLNDIEALEQMLKNKQIEDNIYRIGAEQEFCLITPQGRPAKNGEVLLNAIEDDHFTSELARYNLELNLDPLPLEGQSFSQLEEEIKQRLTYAAKVANDADTQLLLTGILPTISKNELSLDYMTPKPRYFELNKMMKALRGEDFDLNIRGVDHLSLRHDTVLFEACNTSFQLHLQIPPDDFVASYNWAQAISGPVLSVCTNSPLLLGRELWSETRIALFQQSIDTRSSSSALKDQQARVSFGLQWAKGSIAEIYKNDVVRHKAVFTKENIEDALETLNAGKTPKLSALSLHNGTIYRWNRPCYGTHDGVAHLRIENRYIPSGPTVADQMANFAFWVGLMRGRPAKYDNMEKVMDFKDAKNNFVKAARYGKETMLRWDGKVISVEDLIKEELVPIARQGLEISGVNKDDINRYLEIIVKRTEGETGSQWIIRNYRKLRKKYNQDEALIALTKSIYNHQQTGYPVHEWPSLHPKVKKNTLSHLVGHIMSTQVFIVRQDDLAALAISIMHWKKIHHVPVEDNRGRLVGLLTGKNMEQYKSNPELKKDETSVEEIMTKNVVTVSSDTPIDKAVKMMKKYNIGCLPVMHDHHLVGIITKKDIIAFDDGRGI